MLRIHNFSVQSFPTIVKVNVHKKTTIYSLFTVHFILVKYTSFFHVFICIKLSYRILFFSVWD